MHHCQNFIYIELLSEGTYLYKKKELRLINLKALGGLGGDGLPPPTQGDLPFFLAGHLKINSIRVRVRYVKPNWFCYCEEWEHCEEQFVMI